MGDDLASKMELIRIEIPELFASCLVKSENDNTTILTGLKAINFFLEFSKKKLKGMLNKSFQELSVITYLEDLALDKNTDISELANGMLVQYFKSTEEIRV